jgi:hypothetical protein
MELGDKELLKTALRNGLLWTTVLLIITYFRNGLINWYYAPLWFLFFAGTGALRHYYFTKNKDK